MKKAVIFAPFWRQLGHVGNNRIDRFVRWLFEDGYHVVIIRAGSIDGHRNESWGTEITVRDPMGLFRDVSPSGVQPHARKPNKLRRTFFYLLFNPDPSVVWAYLAARHPFVLEAVADAEFILSSNPPESAHVGAWKISRKLGLPHIVDMRDGWLDEPIKPVLQIFAFRRWQEARLEKIILNNASVIFVTSEVWRELLCERIPKLANKVTVLTNGYPLSIPKTTSTEKTLLDKGMVLIHAGRFSGSDTRRTPDLILQPLLDAIKQKVSRGTIKLIGVLSVDELKIIDTFVSSFAEQGWHIECVDSLPRQQLLALLPQADGLLLLSASYAAIPSKLFEYIPSGRPILAVTERGSATWRICEKLPQAVLLESNAVDNEECVMIFLKMATCHNLETVTPANYTENTMKTIFLMTIKQNDKKEVL